MRIDEETGAGVMRLPAGTVVELSRFRQARHLPISRLERGDEVEVVIRNHVNRGEAKFKGELVNQYHPLVRLIAASPGSSVQNDAAVAIQVSAIELGLGIPPADYTFAAEMWTFEGARKEETVRAVFAPVGQGDLIAGELAFDVLNGLRAKGADWADAGCQIEDRARAADRLAFAKSRLPRMFRDLLEQKNAENSDRIRIQRESLRRAHERRVATLNDSVLKVADARRVAYRAMTKGKISALKKQYEIAAARLDHHERLVHNRAGIVAGVLRVVP
jgi:hypothetical protein